MIQLLARIRSAWRTVTRSRQLEADMDEEMRLHLDMHAARLARERGLDALEARRQAYIAFGGVERYKEASRDTRAFKWVDSLTLDARLGVRILVKHRGLTLVGGFAMAVAIGIGVTCFEVISEVLNPALPLEEGNRVVTLQYASSNPGNPERRVLHDFVAWRETLGSVEQLSAFRTVQHNLACGTAPPEPVKVAEMTASGFVVARTPPLLGRYLLPSDEREAAQPAAVIGYQAWQARFAGDPQIVGRTISLGGTPRTIVGVMPDGFRFPVDHQFWIPLRANPVDYERLHGPSLFMFGRLVPGVSLEKAQAELTLVGQRAAAQHPETHGHLRPLVLPYTRQHLDLSHPSFVWALRIGQLLLGALAFVVAINLAILIYARTVTRLGEIAVRTALGASRGRILAQLFVEALALSLVGAFAGLLLAGMALGRIEAMAPANGSVPFWLDFDLSAASVLYALGLAVLAAAMMGVLPGLKATGRSVNANLSELNGRTGTRLGPVWTTLIVAQVAAAVAVLPVSVYLAWQVVQMELVGPGFAAEEIVVGTVMLSDQTAAPDSNRLRSRQLELMSRLRTEPGVSLVTFSSSVPGMAGSGQIEFEGGGSQRDEHMQEASTLHVGLDLFETYGASILAGRGFDAGDQGSASVVVNRTFVRKFLDDRSALGIRFRYVRDRTETGGGDGKWYQVVGVVRDFPSFVAAPGSDGEPTIYHSAAPGDLHPVALSVRFGGNVPAGFVERFRRIGAEVDPEIQLRRVRPLSEFYNEVRSVWRYLGLGIGLVTASVLLLSAAGIYALMSFTVAQRTREIGIRTALGASPHQLLFGIFGRVMRQLVLGVLVGSLVSAGVFLNVDLSVGRTSSLLLAVAAIMLIVGLLAALGPARRGLRIQASEALRADG